MLISSTFDFDVIFAKELGTCIPLNLLDPLEFERLYPEKLTCSAVILPLELDNSKPKREISLDMIILPFDVTIFPLSV